MKRTVITLTVAFMVLFAAPASAEPRADWYNNPDHRFSTTEICVQQTSRINKRWGLEKAIATWNSSGVVHLTLAPQCTGDTIFANQYNSAEDYRGGYAHWADYQNGFWDETYSIWNYHQSTFKLNRNELREYFPKHRKCFGWAITVHEIGHSLGLNHNDFEGSVMAQSPGYYNNCSGLNPIDLALIDFRY